VFSKLKKNKVINKINKFNLLLEFLIQFESETTSCYYCNIITKSSSNLALIEFKNLLITFLALDCVNKIVDK